MTNEELTLKIEQVTSNYGINLNEPDIRTLIET